MSFIKDTFFGGAQKDAARIQAQSGDRAIEATLGAEQRARQDLEPFRQVGVNTLGDLSSAARADSAKDQRGDLIKLTSTSPGRTQGDQALMDTIFGANQFQSALSQSPDSRALDRLTTDTLGGSAYQNFVNQSPDAASLQRLQNLIATPMNTAMERKEGFGDILAAGAATGKRAAGGTFRDLASYNDQLNERNRSTRVGELSSLIGMESALRGQREGELLTGRQQGLGEVRDLIGIEERNRSNRLNELLLGRQQSLNEYGVAGDTERAERDRRLDELLARVNLNTSADATQYNRLFDLTNIGANAAAGSASAALRTGENIADIRIGQGNVRGATTQGYGNIARNTIFDLIKLREQGSLTG